MLQGRDYVVFSDDWGRWPSSSQHLFRRIAKQSRVLWVETLGMRRPRPSRADLRRSVEKIRSWTGREPEEAWAEPPEGLIRFAPPMHPWFGSRLGNRSNDLLLVRAVRRKMKAEGIRKPIVVITVPIAAGVLGHLGEVTSVYYLVDDFALWPGYAARAIRGRERELLARTDGLVVTAKALRVPGFKGPTMRLDHGVDLEHFGSAGAPPQGMPPSPRLLFAGRIDQRLDRALLLDLPGNLVLLGARTHPTQLPGATVLPPVSYEALPRWLAAADVLLLPYTRTALTDTIQPLKLREYLATGRPIAATPLPEIKRIAGDLVQYGEGERAFTAAVARALAEGPAQGLERQRRVEKDSWEERAKTFTSFLAELLP